MRTNPVYLTRADLAERWHCKHHTLENWASKGHGPRFRILGGRALYELADVEAYERGRVIDPVARVAGTRA